MFLLSSCQILLSLIIISLFVIYSLRKKWRNGRKQQENDSTSNKYGENSSVSGENKDNGQELKKSLPTMSILPFLWNIVFSQCDKQYHDSYIGILNTNLSTGLPMLFTNEKVVCINIFGYKLIFFLHPESAKEVLRSNSLTNRDSVHDFFKPLFGDNSFLYSSDDDWRRRRKYFAPHFHLRNLKDDQNVFMEHSNVLVEKLKQLQKNEIFDILEWMKYCTLDIIADIAVGVSLHSQTTNDQEYMSAMRSEIMPLLALGSLLASMLITLGLLGPIMLGLSWELITDMLKDITAQNFVVSNRAATVKVVDDIIDKVNLACDTHIPRKCRGRPPDPWWTLQLTQMRFINNNYLHRYQVCHLTLSSFDPCTLLYISLFVLL
ncbi:uncharacterized protein LOC111614825 [Centruroides sculpturatus]|uniref:uncharacterized protein LOC111614825 n=1 Tax=Centruroides sculpturatus TaxID=218467 RepID=UPI000C6D7A78|nr:uncharacterized protein LOC111614825 [Centruroides sculpturatus]